MSVYRRSYKNKDGTKVDKWVVDVDFEHADGRRERIRKVSPMQTKRGAEEYERQVRQALLSPDRVKKEVPTLAEFVPQFMTYVKNNNRPNTVKTRQCILDLHLIPALGSKRLDAINEVEIENLKNVLKNKISAGNRSKMHLNAATINIVLLVLKRMLRIAQEWKIISGNPRLKLLKKGEKKFDFLSFEEADRLIEVAPPDLRIAIMIALKAGLRIGEIIGLQWNDIDFDNATIIVRRSISDGNIGPTKSGRSRTVDIPRSLVEALRAHRHSKGLYVFCRPDGSPMTEGRMNALRTKVLCNAGISREGSVIGWHDLRHTYASHLAMKGVPLKVIQELLGHSTIDMTMLYAHLSPETKRSAVQVLDRSETNVTERHNQGTASFVASKSP